MVERPLLAGIGAVPLCRAKRLAVAKRSTLRTSPMISAATITPTPWISVSVVPRRRHERAEALLEHAQLAIDAPQIGQPQASEVALDARVLGEQAAAGGELLGVVERRHTRLVARLELHQVGVQPVGRARACLA